MKVVGCRILNSFLGKIATMTRMAGGQKTVISWQDAPDDLFFRATAAAKKVSKVTLCL